MSDQHHHHHGHSHSHNPVDGELSETQKILKLLHHWIHHNDDHATNYIDWAGKIELLGFPSAAERLRKAAELTQAVSREFKTAAVAIQNQEKSD
jgi:hypothetical protein